MVVSKGLMHMIMCPPETLRQTLLVPRVASTHPASRKLSLGGKILKDRMVPKFFVGGCICRHRGGCAGRLVHGSHAAHLQGQGASSKTMPSSATLRRAACW